MCKIYLFVDIYMYGVPDCPVGGVWQAWELFFDQNFKTLNSNSKCLDHTRLEQSYAATAGIQFYK